MPTRHDGVVRREERREDVAAVLRAGEADVVGERRGRRARGASAPVRTTACPLAAAIRSTTRDAVSGTATAVPLVSCAHHSVDHRVQRRVAVEHAVPADVTSVTRSPDDVDRHAEVGLERVDRVARRSSESARSSGVANVRSASTNGFSAMSSMSSRWRAAA